MQRRSMAMAATALGLPLALPDAGAQELVPVNLWVADIAYDGPSVRISAPRKLTGDRGINSQPSFTPDGNAVLFVSRRDSVAAQSDVYRVDLATLDETRITHTPEMENSPTVTPDGDLMVIRWVPATLFREWGPWIYDMQGTPLRGVLPGPDTVGYYVRVDSVTFAMVRPRSPTWLSIFDMRTGSMTDVDAPVANLPPQLIPAERAVSYTRTDSLGRNELWRVDLSSGERTLIAPALFSRTAHAWTPRGILLMARGNRLFALDSAAQLGWREIAMFSDPELQNVNAYTVSARGDRLILISPVKPELHVLLRDALQDGARISDLERLFTGLGPAEAAGRYQVSRRELTRIVDERKAHGTSDSAALEALVVQLTGPAQEPERR